MPFLFCPLSPISILLKEARVSTRCYYTAHCVHSLDLCNELLSILLSKLQEEHRVRVEMTFCTESRDVCIRLVIIYFTPSFSAPFNSLSSCLCEDTNMSKIWFCGKGDSKKEALSLDFFSEIVIEKFGVLCLGFGM